MRNWLLKRGKNTVENNKTRKSWKALVHLPLSFCSKSSLATVAKHQGPKGEVIIDRIYDFFILLLCDLWFRISRSFSVASWNQLQKSTQSTWVNFKFIFLFSKGLFLFHIWISTLGFKRVNVCLTLIPLSYKNNSASDILIKEILHLIHIIFILDYQWNQGFFIIFIGHFYPLGKLPIHILLFPLICFLH